MVNERSVERSRGRCAGLIDTISEGRSSGRCLRLVDTSSFFSLTLVRTLTHLTADMAFFTPLPPGESDYEKWKSVFNVIQGLEEVKYFVCVREKATVFGRFSSLNPLAGVLAAVVKMKAPNRKEKMELNWLDEMLAVKVKLNDDPLSATPISSVSSRLDLKLKGASWCSQFWKVLCCLKR